MKQTARSVAYECVYSVATDDAYANLLLPKLLDRAGLDDRDAGLAQELTFGTLRWQGLYDAIIAKCAARPVDEIDPKALSLLRLGAHQLLGMRVPTHAALNETVELAKRVASAGAVGFVNGVLRRISEKPRDTWIGLLTKNQSDPNAALAIRFSHPVWVVRALAEALKSDSRSEDLEDLLEADNIPPLVSLVALPGLANLDDLLAVGAIAGNASPIGAELPEGNPAEIEAVRRGRIRVQDQGSQLAALALLAAKPIEPNEEWLDLCAGPGGKAALLAAEAELEGAEFFANEITPHRATLVEQALRPINAGLYVRVGDGRELGSDAPESFDRILLDAPCTGLGALRRRPEARWRKQQSDVQQLAKLQGELLESAWAGLKPGGVLAYVTCSPHLAETTAVIDLAQKHFGTDLELLDANAVLKTINPNLKLNSSRKTVQLWPHLHGTDAMFIALLQKRASEPESANR